ncbi:MAG: hypothetical protein SFU27_05120 [Thermonemataceae bacterium]|nr:hypothetical protein [Thermonemataceae bacterium]
MINLKGINSPKSITIIPDEKLAQVATCSIRSKEIENTPSTGPIINRLANFTNSFWRLQSFSKLPVSELFSG